MSTHSVTIHYGGLEIEADVYVGTTPSSGDDPSSIENMRIVGVVDLAALNEFLVDQLYDKDSVLEEIWEATETA